MPVHEAGREVEHREGTNRTTEVYEMTTARDVMTADPRIVGTNESAEGIAKILASENIGAVVVCNDEKRLQGVITDRDLAVGVVAKGKDPSSTTASQLVDGSEVVTIGADDSVDEAIATMKSHAVQADLAQMVEAEQVKDLLSAVSAADDNTLRG